MPELPEVQTTVNGLNRRVRDLKIIDVWTDYNSAFQMGKDSVKDPSYFKYFKKKIVGKKVKSARRLAKNVLIDLDSGDVILVHMKMTGHLMYGRYIFDKKNNSWTPSMGESDALRDPFNRFVRLVFTFSNGKNLVLSDMRKFAKITLVPKNHLKENLEKSVHLSNIGPDPLEKNFIISIFKERLSRKPNGRIKTVLMDQSIIAGVGNIYSDEALWRASLNPEERIKNIPNNFLKKLYSDLKIVLKKGIDFGGDSMSDYRNIDGKKGKFQGQHRAYRKTGERCSLIKNGERCKGIITRKIVGGRSAHFCSVHQKLLKPAVNRVT
jgi:formamidopyrimidine-DNA glycosylase